MSNETNKAVVQQFLDRAFNQHDLSAIDDFFSSDYVDHLTPPGFPPGKAGAKQFLAMYFQAIPDMHASVEDILADGDRVASRVTYAGTQQGPLMQIPPTGRRASVSGMHIHRIADGKIAEHWGVLDIMGLMQQLGVIPPPGQ